MKRYVLIWEEDPANNVIHCRGDNDGFNSSELLGMIDLKRDDIIRQMRGEIAPIEYERLIAKETEEPT